MEIPAITSSAPSLAAGSTFSRAPADRPIRSRVTRRLFCPGTPNPAEAQPVSVGLGQEITLNLSLVARMARLGIPSLTPQGRPAAGAYLNLLSRGGGFLSMVSEWDSGGGWLLHA